MEDDEVNIDIVEEDDTDPYALVQKESKVWLWISLPSITTWYFSWNTNQ
jgi:hypothetical protein